MPRSASTSSTSSGSTRSRRAAPRRTGRTEMRALLTAALLAASGAALGCGYCVEDKIASTYDHAVVTRAIGARHHVVYFHIDGPLVQDAPTGRALVAAAQSVRGVDRDSV